MTNISIAFKLDLLKMTRIWCIYSYRGQKNTRRMARSNSKFNQNCTYLHIPSDGGASSPRFPSTSLMSAFKRFVRACQTHPNT